MFPAPRGFIRFTDDFQSVYSVPLDCAIDYKVRLVDDGVPERKYPFYPGDRVKSKETGALGEVINPKAQGYEVRFDGYEGTTWVPNGSLRLIDKDLTTRNYIKSSEDEFKVVYGDVEEAFDEPRAAVDYLLRSNRPAFNRLSKLIRSEGVKDFSWVDSNVLNYFLNKDSKIWNRELVEEYEEQLKDSE